MVSLLLTAAMMTAFGENVTPGNAWRGCPRRSRWMRRTSSAAAGTNSAAVGAAR